jgi:ribosomal protein S10
MLAEVMIHKSYLGTNQTWDLWIITTHIRMVPILSNVSLVKNMSKHTHVSPQCIRVFLGNQHIIVGVWHSQGREEALI